MYGVFGSDTGTQPFSSWLRSMRGVAKRRWLCTFTKAPYPCDLPFYSSDFALRSPSTRNFVPHPPLPPNRRTGSYPPILPRKSRRLPQAIRLETVIFRSAERSRSATNGTNRYSHLPYREVGGNTCRRAGHSERVPLCSPFRKSPYPFLWKAPSLFARRE